MCVCVCLCLCLCLSLCLWLCLCTYTHTHTQEHVDYGRLGFTLTAIIDDLVDFGIRGDGGPLADKRVFQLIALLFSSLFRHVN